MSLQLIDAEDADNYGVDHIVVHYGNRSVTLSAKEIMDALEGKG